MYGGIATALFLVFSLMWVGYTINKIPSDISIIRYNLKENKMMEFWTDLGVSVFFWVTSILISIFIIYPWSLVCWSGLKNIYALITGMR